MRRPLFEIREVDGSFYTILDKVLLTYQVFKSSAMLASNEKELPIEVIQVKKAALIFRAINHPLRKQMLQLLHENVRMTVTEIFIKLRLEQSVASQHLAVLRKAGMVNTERQGKFIFYSVNYQRIKQVHQVAGDFINHPL
jgi:DNA-binding transcriptional ArsR family regulator